MTRREYDKLQMKNHWDVLRRDWQQWDNLMHGESGLGWDPVRKTVDAADYWRERNIAGSGVGSMSFGVDDDDDTTIGGEEGDIDDVQPLVGASLDGMTTNVNTNKYYVVNAGYPSMKGHLAPYKGPNICYLLLDFRRGSQKDFELESLDDNISWEGHAN
ncbi:hypothetical protein RJ639_021919 [Escallonia herrerae]|uniref:Myb/SANT-like domain-containing protein n=1 Tax=Escallonia herrerae TaxID=1293975 RepID=A0AA89AFJ8_9ASTE|nr:hypothetical protein RJ639_021919 [Escallonia herrerae]